MADTATIGSMTGAKYFNKNTGIEIDRETYSGYGSQQKSNYRVEHQFDEYTYNEDTKAWEKTGNTVPKNTTNHYDTIDEAAGKRIDATSTEWGAANITKEMFVDEQGEQRSIEDIYATLDPLMPGITGDKLKLQIRDMMPKYTGAPAEEKEFAREGFQKDVYGISKDAGKAGAQMQQAYGSGMGSQMRGAYGAQKDVAQQFKQAEQGYAQDIYGLEKQAGQEFEAGVSDWMQGSWFETPDVDYRQGGRVPNKKSFLDVLTAIPDAGGS